MAETRTVPCQLSALAQRLLQELGIGRDAAWTVGREELREELAAMGWPCSEEVLCAEESVGGFRYWTGNFGVHASLRLVGRDVPWDYDDLLDYSLRADPRDSSKMLIPLWMLDDPWIWLGVDGCVFYGSHIDGPDYFTFAFEDVCHYWEVLALLDGYVVASLRDADVDRPRLEASGFVGEAVARELGLSAFAPATRGTTRAWVGQGARVVELDIPGFKEGTDVVSDAAEGIVLAAIEALNAGCAARIISPEALDDVLLAALPVPTGEMHPTSRHHVYTWGKPTGYAHPEYRRRHRESLEIGGSVRSRRR